MHRARRLSPFAAVVAALLLTASPVAAAGPFTPSTGHWSSADGAVHPAFGSSGWIAGTRIGPDGRLYAYGKFDNASGNATADNLAVFDAVTKTWTGLGSDGAGDGALSNAVNAIAWIGSDLYAGGDFMGAAGIGGADYIARWDGAAWHRVGPAGAFNDSVYALQTLKIGSSSWVYAGGAFANAGGDPVADHVAVWDGTTWSGLSYLGATDGAITDSVYGMFLKADGELYVVGAFVNDGAGGKCDYACWWDNASEGWYPIGGALGKDSVFNDSAHAVYVDGTRVYVGGGFTNAAGIATADYLAVWTGAKWANVGTNGVGGAALNNTVRAITKYGTNFIVTGSFTNAGGVAAADDVGVWNGSRWLSVGTSGGAPVALSAMVTGRVLYLAGSFSTVAAVANTQHLAAYGLPAAPSAPRSLAGLTGYHRVTLTWLAPSSNNGGGAVTDYIVQYRRYGTTTWKTFADGVRTTRSAVVTGLSTGVRYQFRVAAKNAWGIGPYSTVITRWG